MRAERGERPSVATVCVIRKIVKQITKSQSISEGCLHRSKCRTEAEGSLWETAYPRKTELNEVMRSIYEFYCLKL